MKFPKLKKSDPSTSNEFKKGKSLIKTGRFTYGIENIDIKEYGEGANLTIGSFCSLATNITVFLGGNHRSDWISTFPFGHIYQDKIKSPKLIGHPSTNGDIKIGSDVWIGHGSTIMSGIEIGSGSIIAANSVVTKDVPPYTIAGGNPAKLIKTRFSNDAIDLLLEIKWWDLSLDSIENIIPILCQHPNISTLKKILQDIKINSY